MSAVATDQPATAPSLTGRITATAAVRIAGLAGTLLGALVLARLLGADEFGRNALALSWAGGLGAVALAGTDQLLLREMSVNGDSTRDGALRAFARRQALLPTTVAGGLAVAVSLVTLGPSLLPAVLAVVVFFGPMRRRQAVLLATGRTGLAQAGEWLGLPLVQLTLAVPVLLWTHPAHRSAVITVTAYAVAIAAVVGVQSRMTRPREAAPHQALASAAQQRVWTQASRSFALVSTAVIAQASIDLWILGAFGDNAEVGSYAVAARLAALVALPLTVATFALSRDAAVLHAAGDTAALQRDVTTIGRLTTATACVIASAVLVVAPLLGSLLGESFRGVTAPLLILLAGQLSNVVIGPVATLLLMSGFERDVRNTLLAATVLNAGLTVTLVPLVGAVGAATGAAVSLTAWNIVLRARVRRDLGVSTGPFALSRLR